MNQRKFRTHIHGYSNRKSRTLSGSSDEQKNLSSNCQFKNPSPEGSFLKHSYHSSALPLGERKLDLIQTEKSLNANSIIFRTKPLKNSCDLATLHVERQIKNAYATKNNLKRIIKGWNLHQRRTLSPNQLRTTLKLKLNIDVSEDDAKKLVVKYSKEDAEKLDVKDFVQLIKSDCEEVSFKPHIHQSWRKNPHLDSKIKSLIEDLSHYKKNANNTETQKLDRISSLIKSYNNCSAKLRSLCPQQPKGKSQNIVQLMKNSKRFRENESKAFEQVSQKIGLDNTLSAIYNLEDQNQTISDAFFSRKLTSRKDSVNLEKTSLEWGFRTNGWNQNSKYRITTKFKTLEAEPKSMFGVDQRKTRFGATTFRKTDLNINLDQLKTQSKLGNQKQKINLSLAGDRLKEREKYQNKLAKIRFNRENQKQNILKLEKRMQATDQANMTKLRFQNEAYSYSTFIQNKWR